MIKEESEFYAVMYKDKFWGKQVNGGNYTIYGYGSIEKADKLESLEFCTSPKDFTYEGSHHEDELSKGKFVKIKQTITLKINNIL